ncbi:hypothetical protein I350_01298 [Cryptococcus amylolentus CBS 6273]|uniref:Uncharacterized protein n=1 Tax=Cryptococcus amylolentus CBS 6273 TaxID=1296118 RepID=A0A1E3KC79_9TREE|nr:hypothetical protein I350_01298 [Cryptococcus amylolentus CBS 6273]
MAIHQQVDTVIPSVIFGLLAGPTWEACDQGPRARNIESCISIPETPEIPTQPPHHATGRTHLAENHYHLLELLRLFRVDFIFMCPLLWLIGMTITSMWIPLRPVEDEVDPEKARKLEEMIVILHKKYSEASRIIFATWFTVENT